jgi:hypothetical protein
MAIATESLGMGRGRTSSGKASEGSQAQPRQVATVKLWALFGVVVIAFETYVLIKWVSGPNFEHVAPGPTPVPEFIKIAASVVTYGGIPAALWCIYNWVVKPWRRSRIVTPEGLILVWFMTFGWFMDPWANWAYPFFTYNAWLWNMGSWVHDIPGWTSITAGSPGKMQAYPMLFIVTAYIWGLAGIIFFQTWAMRKIRARYPTMSTPMLIFIMFWICQVTFLILESVYMRCGIYGYHASIPSLTLWYGHYYQMPIYETIYAAFWCVGYSSLLFFRNDKGQTLVERGIDKVQVGPVGKVALRFAAMTGLCFIIYNATYNIPYYITNTIAQPPWPKHARENSYWTNGICGPGAEHACPTRDIPVGTKKSGFVDMKGNLVDSQGNVVVENKGSWTPPEQTTQFKTELKDKFWGDND